MKKVVCVQRKKSPAFNKRIITFQLGEVGYVVMYALTLLWHQGITELIHEPQADLGRLGTDTASHLNAFLFKI